MDRSFRKKRLIACGIAPVALIASMAHAQDAPPASVAAEGAGAQSGQEPRAPDPSSAANAQRIADIVVTANRQEQSLQKVSGTVGVVDGAKLRDQALVNVAQIFADVPNVQIVAQPQGYSIAIRGQSYDGPASVRQAPVALEFDGVYNISALATAVGFFDVGRIETLPGPQSTRYGPNALGGLINVISRDPELGNNAGSASLTVGNYALVRGEIAQNIAIGDDLAIRLSGAAIHRNSYFKPASGNAVGQSGRIKVLYNPSDRLTLKAQYQIDHLGGTGVGDETGTSFYVSRVSGYPGDSINDYSNPWRSPLVFYSGGCYSNTSPNSGVCGPADSHANLYQHTIIGSLDYRLTDWAAVDVTQAYVKENGTQKACYSGGFGGPSGSLQACSIDKPFAPFHEWSTEVRLHNVGGNVLWNVGYYRWSYAIAHYPGAYPGCGQGCPASTGGTTSNMFGASSTRTNAAFADATVPVIDRLRLIGGIRYSWDDLRSRMGQQPQLSGGFHNFDYRVGQEFDVTPSVMEYLTLSTGYSPGGLYTSNNQQFKYPSQKIRAYELGLKSRLFDNVLQLNLAAYYYQDRNFPITNSYGGFTIPAGQPNAGTYCPPLNFGSAATPVCQVPVFTVGARTKGAEAQIKFAPTRNDLFGASLSFIDERYEDKQGTCNIYGLAEAGFPTNDGNCYSVYADFGPAHTLIGFRVNGLVFPHAPKFSGTFSYSHIFHLGSGASFDVGGDAVHFASYYVHPDQANPNLDTREGAFQPGYWQENLRASFRPASDRWSILAYIRNVSNYAVKLSSLPATTIGDPRTYGATFNVKW